MGRYLIVIITNKSNMKSKYVNTKDEIDLYLIEEELNEGVKFAKVKDKTTGKYFLPKIKGGTDGIFN